MLHQVPRLNLAHLLELVRKHAQVKDLYSRLTLHSARLTLAQ